MNVRTRFIALIMCYVMMFSVLPVSAAGADEVGIGGGLNGEGDREGSILAVSSQGGTVSPEEPEHEHEYVFNRFEWGYYTGENEDMQWNQINKDEWNWPEDVDDSKKKCIAVFICGKCEGTVVGHEKKESAEITWDEEDAACEKEGKKTYKASVRVEGEKDPYTDIKEVSISKKGHSYGEWKAEVDAKCTTPGTKGHYECGVCHKYFDKEKNEIKDLTIPKKGHSYGEWKAEVDAKCTVPGTKGHYECGVCRKYFDEEKNEIEDLTIPKKGHSYGEWKAEVDAKCTTPGTKGHYECGVCHKYFDKEKNEIKDLTIPKKGHSYGEWKAEIDATCTAPGTKGHYECELCHKYFDKEKNEIKDVTISEKGHSYGEWKAEIDATCTAPGTKGHYECENCYAYFDKDDQEITDIVIQPVGHKLKTITAQAPTCTAAGNREYRTCDICEKHFSDAEGKTEMKPNSWIAPATGHSITTRMQSPTDTAEGVLTHSCDNCGYVKEKLVLPKKTMQIELGQTARVISDASKCTFTLVNANKYQDYLTVDQKTGEIKTDTKKLKKLKKIEKSADIQVTTGGMTYSVKASLSIPAPAVKITTKKVGDRYRFTFKYNVKKLGASKIKVTCSLKGLKKDVFNRYLSSPKSNKDSYVNLYLGTNKKVKFTITAYYGKKGKIVSQKTVKTFAKNKKKLTEVQ